jgi:hypothetical protein
MNDYARDAFEEWVQSRPYFKRLSMNLKRTGGLDNGNYCCFKVNDRWQAWKAAIIHVNECVGEEL